jgi:hypothetical protein
MQGAMTGGSGPTAIITSIRGREVTTMTQTVAHAYQLGVVQLGSPKRSSVKWRRLMKLVIATAAALELVTPTPMHAASEMACMVMWDKADVNKNGTLEGNEATTYLDAIRKSGKKYELKTVDQLNSTEFMAACKDDVFKISSYRV